MFREDPSNSQRGDRRGRWPRPAGTIRGWVLGTEASRGGRLLHPSCFGLQQAQALRLLFELVGERRLFQSANGWRGSKQPCLWQMGPQLSEQCSH